MKVLTSLLFFVCVIQVSCTNRSPSQADILNTKLSGDFIVEAIKAYSTDHSGNPPTLLSELVPGYISSIPNPISSSRWSYVVFNDTEFCLSHDWGGGDPVIYNYGNGWSTDTK